MPRETYKQISDLHRGDHVVVWGLSKQGYEDWGQGGSVLSAEGTTVTLKTPVSTVAFDLSDTATFPHGGVVIAEEPLDASECLDYHLGDCQGAVDYRAAISGTGRSFPRCDRHWSERLDRQEQINRRYPDSPFPPSDFDPEYAGESWNEEY